MNPSRACVVLYGKLDAVPWEFAVPNSFFAVPN